ncbi:MAG: UbiA family prenyltransferase [Candidatus Eisenbacteria bacterium]|nr:UbiA family prenyltransferase [Candidatus Eisenbacteria bacterium]MCC7144028.1 UbiA family prenyltransferase [Candidatus Eisenbacteria bacterium]
MPNRMTLQDRLKLYWEFSRPFTLIAPALGMLSGGVTALGAGVPSEITGGLLLKIVFGTLMAAVLNGASNGINQIYDLDVDRVNKPKRPIPSGRLSTREAGWVTLVLYLVAALFAALVNLQCFVLASAAAFLTIIYSVPPIRTKRNAILANLTIAIPRGLLLKVAGWSMTKDAFHGGEAWYIGAIFGLFLLGASTTKDFADMKGDAAGGCITLPVKYGARRAAWMIAPFFVLPFLLIPIGVMTGMMSGHPVFLYALGAILVGWGAYTVSLILRDPDALATTENHVSWRHMYMMMFFAQTGFMVSYLAKYFLR